MTIISHKYRLIYIHLHKCAGTSIEKSFENHMGLNDLIIGSTDHGEQIQSYYRNKFGIHKHNTVKELIPIVGKKRWNQYITFTTIRDPKTLYKSYYNWAASKIHWSSRGEPSLIDKWKRHLKMKNYDPKFLSWGAIQAYLNTDNFPNFVKLTIRKTMLPGTFSSRLEDSEGNINIDQIVKLEEMNKAWDFLEKEIGKKLTNIRENKSLKFETLYDEESKELINNFHNSDFKNFNYKKFKV